MIRVNSTASGSLGEKFGIFWMCVFLVAFSLNYWGIISNQTVLAANGGYMPVVGMKNDATHFEFQLPDNGKYERRPVESGKLLFLGDWIRVRFPSIKEYVPDGVTGRPIRWWAKHFDYPLDEELSYVSPGDIMRWVGSILFLALIPMAIIGIPFCARMNRLAHGNWRGGQVLGRHDYLFYLVILAAAVDAYRGFQYY